MGRRNLSQWEFWYSMMFILSTISVGSIFFLHFFFLFLLPPPSPSSFSIFCPFASFIVKISPSPQCLDDFCLVRSVNWSFRITVSYLGAEFS